MTPKQLVASLVILILTWVGVIVFICLNFFRRKPDPKEPNNYQRIVKKFKPRIQSQRLCGYHLTAQYRHSTVAIVDGRNCEVCAKEENAKKGKKK